MPIRVKLARVMGDKHLHIMDVHRSTGIARSTLTRLWYDKAKGIDFETLDKLCRFLQCEPKDILEYKPE